MRDGRTFVTDGGLAIDAALAKAAKLPDRELATKILEDYLGAAHKDECGFKDSQPQWFSWYSTMSSPCNCFVALPIRTQNSFGP